MRRIAKFMEEIFDSNHCSLPLGLMLFGMVLLDQERMFFFHINRAAMLFCESANANEEAIAAGNSFRLLMRLLFSA